MSQYQSRIPFVDENDPTSWGRDDITGLPTMMNDMVKVMQYAGRNVVWTGWMTRYDLVDIPQPQLAPAYLRPDPQTIPIVRPFSRPTMPPIPTGLTVLSSTSNSITVQWDSVSVATSYVLAWADIVVVNPIADIPTSSTSTVTYTITGLAPRTYYLLQVATTYPEATSAYSDPISFTTPSS